jgi:hypothetical protein
MAIPNFAWRDRFLFLLYEKLPDFVDHSFPLGTCATRFCIPGDRSHFVGDGLPQLGDSVDMSIVYRYTRDDVDEAEAQQAWMVLAVRPQ